MRHDMIELQKKLMKISATDAAEMKKSISAIEQEIDGNLEGAAGPQVKHASLIRTVKAKNQLARQHSHIIGYNFKSTVKKQYPCYVISLSQLQAMERLLPHEQCREQNLLVELTPTTVIPSMAFTFFVSQDWESGDRSKELGPDNEHHTKIQWLHNMKEHLSIPSSIEIWVWLSYVSVPQANRKLQLKAISSLPYYARVLALHPTCPRREGVVQVLW